MTEQTHNASKDAERRTDVDQTLRRATDDAAEQHPAHASTLRATLDGLRARLAQLHAHSDAASDPSWSDYRDRLDRGLDEFHIELARANEQPAGAVDEVLFTTASQLELDGWRLHFETRQEQLARGGKPELDRLRELATLDVDQQPREQIEATLKSLRAAADQTEPS